MSAITESGYPSNYHLGISMIFWFILIGMDILWETSLFRKAHKTNLINRKELLKGNAYMFVGPQFTFIFVQIGVLLPQNFVFFIALANATTLFFSMFFIYYWERNLVSYKKIPTIFSVFICLLSFIQVISILITKKSLFPLFTLILVLLSLIGSIFVFILIITFTKRTAGQLKNRGYMLAISYILFFIVMMMDNPPLVTINPEITSIIAPILLITSAILWYFAVRIICDSIISYYNQARKCVIHRGKIPKNSLIYFCPSCNTMYCQRCYQEVILKESCWNCQKGAKDTEGDSRKTSKSVEVISKEDIHKKKA